MLDIIDALPDIPRELTALAEWLGCMVYILLRQRRVPTRCTALLSVGALVALLAVHRVADLLPLGLWTLGMAAAVATMYAFIRLATGLGGRDTGYVTARAFVLAELVASLHWQLHTFFFVSNGRNDLTWQWLHGAVVYASAFALATLLESGHIKPRRTLSVSGRELASAAGIAGATFFVSNLSFLNANTPFSGRLGAEVFLIRTLVCLFGFVALYAQQGQRMQQRARLEVGVMDAMLEQQHAQYLQFKRNIETVNRKYHDLKHQIGVIRAEPDPARRAEHLDGLEASIAGYAAHVETGHGVLDVILTSKSQLFAEAEVDFTCVVDGAVLGFVPAMDLAALFGNALDNAYEAVMAVPQPDRRLVKVSVSGRDSFALITVENYFHGELATEDGEIVTRKADRTRHGYGLRSIRHTAEKHGGSMTVSTQSSWFSLRILIPLPAATATKRPPRPGTLADAAATTPGKVTTG